VLKKLRSLEKRLLDSLRIEYRRYLFDEIDFDDRMIGILGARGVGKTTLLLQYLRDLKKRGENALYLSLDYPFLSGVDLLELVEEFADGGGRYLLLDEVHRYRDFGSYLKSIYDLFDLHVIFTGSSATSILQAKSDLSRRVTLYRMNGFSFREFLELKYQTTLTRIPLEELLRRHPELAAELTGRMEIVPAFQEYLKVGYYPFYFDKRSSYFQNLVDTINLTIDIDLTSLGYIEQKYTYKLKKLLEVICESEPFEVNFTRIATLAEISRVKLYDYIRYLEEGELLLLIERHAKGLKKLNKPAKIYLNNSNLLYAYCDKAKKGTIRETFFANQLSLRHRIEIPPRGDFIVDGKYTFEIGGKGKSFRQIEEIPQSYVAADDIEVGSGNKIPLWLFGLLY